MDGRRALAADGWALAFNADAMTDDIKSTTLIYGHFMSRDYLKLGLVPEKTWKLDPTQRWS